MSASDDSRVSVLVIDVPVGREQEFLRLEGELHALVRRKGYGWDELVQDQSTPQRFYDIRHWTSAEAVDQMNGDTEVQAMWSTLARDAGLRLTHLVDVARPVTGPAPGLERRAARDRREGADRRVTDRGHAEGNRRRGDRRMGPRRAYDVATPLQAAPGQLVTFARRARIHAHAQFSKFRVGAALETASGSVITGCNIENATYGLTVCAERVAMFKALSEGHLAFTRIAIVADTEQPTPPCGACRQILWEFGGDLEVQLANLRELKATYRLKDLLPLPFDARLL